MIKIKLLMVSGIWVFTSILHAQSYSFAVLDFQGKAVAKRKWLRLTSYLTEKIGASIEFNTIQNPGLIKRAKKFDFILTNPVSSVMIASEHNYHIIATLNHKKLGASFGGVIIVPKSSQIKSIKELANKRVGVVDMQSAAGGFLFQAYELVRSGLDPNKDFKNFRTIPNQRKIVKLTNIGRLDAGFIRTGMLEEIEADNKKIGLANIRIINQQQRKGEPFVRSTALYPHWGFLVKNSTPNAIKGKIKNALLKLKADDAICQAAQIRGFVEPVNYEKIKHIMRAVKLPFIANTE